MEWMVGLEETPVEEARVEEVKEGAARAAERVVGRVAAVKAVAVMVRRDGVGQDLAEAEAEALVVEAEVAGAQVEETEEVATLAVSVGVAATETVAAAEAEVVEHLVEGVAVMGAVP